MSRRAGKGARHEGYASISPTRMPRSAFDLSFSHKTTAVPSRLLPVYTQECMPGDTITCSPKVFIRQMSSIYPVMDGMRAEMQFFFCPTRLVWDNWRKMMGEREQPGDHVDYEVPQVVSGAGGFLKESMFDYLGAPTEIVGISISALPGRCCALIYNEWYRDQNLQTAVEVPTDDGPDLPAEPHFKIQYRNKVRDRFGGALPAAQKGDPVTMPLGTTAPVITDGTQITYSATGSQNNPLNTQTNTGLQMGVTWSNDNVPVSFGDSSGLVTDLQNATAVTISTLRQSIALQQLFERDMRGGTRYSEQIYSHFGVRMPDLRYRPTLISVGRMDIYPVEVPYSWQEGSSNGGEFYYLGRPGANVKGMGNMPRWSYSADEWGFIIGFLTIRSEISYSQGVPAHLLRRTRIDHFTPDLALLGEEAIPSIEIYADGTGDREAQTGDWAPWGFTPRYESYRHRVNMISGDLRSYNTDEAFEFGRLDRWHYGLDFGSRPTLSETYLYDDPNPILRNTVHTLAPPFIVDMAFHQTGVRPMPKVATPGLLRL